MTTTLLVVMPCVRAFEDYHEIKQAADLLSSFTGQKIQCAEVDKSPNEPVSGVKKARYYGLFYVGKKPSWVETQMLIATQDGIQ